MYYMRVANYSDRGIVVKFNDKDKILFYSILDRIREIPGRMYRTESRSWLLPQTRKNAELLLGLGFDLCPNLKAYIKRDTVKVKFNNPLLRDYQNTHARNLIKALQENGGALDGSDTGTGKTYVALALAKYFNLIPIVLTPKTVVSVWYKVAKLFDIDKIYASNYEQYRVGNTPYLEVEDIITKNKKGKEKKAKKFYWKTDEKYLLIFDEVHRCKDYRAMNSKMLEKATEQNLTILCLSATVADNPLQMSSVGRAIRLFSNDGGFWHWALNRGVVKGYWKPYEFPEKSKKIFLSKIHEDIYPHKGR